MLVFCMMNAPVLLSAWLLSSRVFKARGACEFFISAFILYLAQIVISELALGILGALFLSNLLILESAILIFVLLATRKMGSALDLNKAKKEIAAILNNKTACFLLAIIAVFGCVKIFINLTNPPFGWDSLNYHFTFPVEWLKQGNLDTPITVSDDPSPTYYPINGSLFFLWLILPLESVFLADLGQVPFFALAVVSAYAISRRIGVSPLSSFYAAALFLIIPNLFKQLSISYVDVMVASLFLAGTYYLFLLEEDFSLKKVLLYSISLGLLLGTKTVAFPYSILLLLPFAYFLLRHFTRAYYGVISAFVITLLGGFSFIRNYLETGNPLYPLDFNFMGIPVFRGVMDTLTYSAHFKIQDYSPGKLLFHEGLGAQTLIFVLPGTLAALAGLIFKKKKISPYLAYFCLLPALLYLVYRYVIPLANTRYLYALLACGMILGFYLFEILRVPLLVTSILVALCALASMSELAKSYELAISIPSTLLLFFAYPFIVKYFKGKRIKIRPGIVIFLIILAVGILGLCSRDYKKNEFQRYKKMVKYSHFWPDAVDAWVWLNGRTAGNNIAYIGRPVPFPLYGENFKNNVYYVSVNKIEPAKLHFFPSGRYRWGSDFSSLHRNLEDSNNYRGQADYATWFSNLKERKIDYLFVYSLHQTENIEFPPEDGWARLHPGQFSPVFTNGTVHIYKISG